MGKTNSQKIKEIEEKVKAIEQRIKDSNNFLDEIS